MHRLTALALALSGCGATYEDTQIAAVVLEPDAALADSVERWAYRWSSATGMSVVVGVGPNAIPVRAVPVTTILPEKNEQACGATLVRRGKYPHGVLVEIAYPVPRPCPPTTFTVAHELGHAIGGAGHTDTGLMRETLPLVEVQIIDEASLALVCAYAQCQEFNPE